MLEDLVQGRDGLRRFDQIFMSARADTAFPAGRTRIARKCNEPRLLRAGIIAQLLNEFFLGDILQGGIEKDQIWLMTPSHDQALLAGWRFQNLELFCPQTVCKKRTAGWVFVDNQNSSLNQFSLLAVAVLI